MINFGAVPAGSVLPVFFSTYGKTNGESVTLSGLAVTDIEIYKGTSMTQRSSDAGYTLLDTDGIDVDGIAGIHAFSIDTGDNTDSGFFAAGSFYNVIVSAVTIDGQTVNFIAATFSIRAAEAVAGVPKVDVTHNAGTAITSASGIQEVKVASIANNAITAASAASDLTTELQSGLATSSALSAIDAKIDTIDDFLDTEIAAILADTNELQTDWVNGGRLDLLIDAIKAKTDNLPSDPADASVVAGLIAALEAKVDTIDDFLDTEIAAILADTNELQTDWVNGGRLDLLIDAIKAKTDNLPSDPADASDVASSFTTVNGKLDTIDDFLDTEIAAIKAKTDNLPAAPAATGDIPTANQNADALLDRSAGVETNRTLRQALRIILAATAGKASGLATTTATYRDTNDSKDRIVATVDADGNRTAVTLDAS